MILLAKRTSGRKSEIVQVRCGPGKPAIRTQPQDQTNIVGTTARFSVAATSSAPLSYHWRKDGVPLSDSTHLSGATDSTLTISNVGAPDVADYAVEVSNVNGAVTSSVARLTLQAPAGLIPVVSENYGENFDDMSSTGTNTPAGWFVGTARYELRLTWIVTESEHHFTNPL